MQMDEWWIQKKNLNKFDKCNHRKKRPDPFHCVRASYFQTFVLLWNSSTFYCGIDNADQQLAIRHEHTIQNDRTCPVGVEKKAVHKKEKLTLSVFRNSVIQK